MVYKFGNKTFITAVGSRVSVMHNIAHHTTGGLTKSKLKYNKSGSIVSKKRSTLAKKAYNSNKNGIKTLLIYNQFSRVL